ncbi:alpha/beta fold hydrolase [Nocardia nova]|uniref:alpha/beta fold hydrolase n=1 Tax=Nocardia nova TaxID=37330 RepID=UPI00268ED0D8
MIVVFVHGHCLRTEAWWFLRDELLRQWGSDTRMVFYDHRGHGDSAGADPATYTIDQLGHDLDAVLRAVAPTGPVVLISHSMGAMVVLAYARLFPATIGTRVVGVGLIAGAAAGITAVGLVAALVGRALGTSAGTSGSRPAIPAVLPVLTSLGEVESPSVTAVLPAAG